MAIRKEEKEVGGNDRTEGDGKTAFIHSLNLLVLFKLKDSLVPIYISRRIPFLTPVLVSPFLPYFPYLRAALECQHAWFQLPISCNHYPQNPTVFALYLCYHASSYNLHHSDHPPSKPSPRRDLPHARPPSQPLITSLWSISRTSIAAPSWCYLFSLHLYRWP
ncbi:hypothetical protein HPP92_026231 [Vanilla planifolia]|uniref:Uncharacterized protein n=1 Tax=Vanilla planifolia TaxID=51239 RepID=A0A835PFY2_VANPL|nr:hypothetical protein HPP92_026231 [Vanilla planifolia]